MRVGPGSVGPAVVGVIGVERAGRKRIEVELEYVARPEDWYHGSGISTNFSRGDRSKVVSIFWNILRPGWTQMLTDVDDESSMDTELRNELLSIQCGLGVVAR